MTYIALAWLAGLMLAVHANVSIPDGFGMTVLVLTIWSLGYLYYRLCRAGRLRAG